MSETERLKFVCHSVPLHYGCVFLSILMLIEALFVKFRPIITIVQDLIDNRGKMATFYGVMDALRVVLFILQICISFSVLLGTFRNVSVVLKYSVAVIVWFALTTLALTIIYSVYLKYTFSLILAGCYFIIFLYFAFVVWGRAKEIDKSLQTQIDNEN